VKCDSPFSLSFLPLPLPLPLSIFLNGIVFKGGLCQKWEHASHIESSPLFLNKPFIWVVPQLFDSSFIHGA
jgi:hypothetical protein